MNAKAHASLLRKWQYDLTKWKNKNNPFSGCLHPSFLFWTNCSSFCPLDLLSCLACNFFIAECPQSKRLACIRLLHSGSCGLHGCGIQNSMVLPTWDPDKVRWETWVSALWTDAGAVGLLVRSHQLDWRTAQMLLIHGGDLACPWQANS